MTRVSGVLLVVPLGSIASTLAPSFRWFSSLFARSDRHKLDSALNEMLLTLEAVPACILKLRLHGA